MRVVEAVTYHIFLYSDDFHEYEHKPRHGRDDLNLIHEIVTFCVGDEVFREVILDNWHNVDCDSMPSAIDRKTQVSEAYEIPIEKLHMYRSTLKIEGID